MRNALLVLLWIALVHLHAAPQKDAPFAKPGDEETLKLSLEVMLYNNDLPHAMQIVQKAIAHYGEQPYWLQKGAQIAAWLSDTAASKRYYLALHRRHSDANTTRALQKLALATHDTRLLIRLEEEGLEHRFDPKSVERLYRYYDQEGYLEEGSRFFAEYAKQHPRKVVFKSRLLLQMAYAPYTEIERGYRAFSKRFGFDPELLYRYAKLCFGRREYLQAFVDIARYEKVIPPSDTKLWSLYLDLATLLDREAVMLSISERLWDKSALPPAYVGMFLRLLQKNAPQKALDVAYTIFSDTPDDRHFFTFAYLAIETGAWERLKRVLTQLQAPLLQKLRHNPHFYEIAAQSALHAGESAEAMEYYQQGLRIAPANISLIQAWLWSAIDTKAPQYLPKALHYAERYLPANHALALPLALGYLQLNASQKALHTIRIARREDPRNWQTMVLHADILALAGREEERRMLLRRAWSLAQKERGMHDFAHADRSRLYDYYRLALHFHPLQRGRWLQEAKRSLKRSQLIDLYLTTLDAAATEAQIAALRMQGASGTDRAFSLALLQNNTVQISKMLDRHPLLSLWDRIAALEKLGAEDREISTLFDAMEENPDNSEVAALFREKISGRPPHATLRLATVRRANLQIIDSVVQITPQPQRKEPLTLTYRNRQYRTGSLHTLHQSVALTLSQKFKQVNLSLKAGLKQRDRTKSIFDVEASRDIGRFTIDLQLSHNEDVTHNNETLLHAGADRASAAVTYRFNRYQSLHARLDKRRYFDDAGRLGEGTGALLAYRRDLRLGYPGIYYRLFLEGEEIDDHSGILADSYWQSGIHAGYGEEQRGRMQDGYRPYGGATLLFNSRTRLGYSMLAGIGGQLFGRDRIDLESYYSNGLGAFEEAYFALRLRYRFQ